MVTVIECSQLIACAGLVWITVVQSWRAGEKFWSGRGTRR